MLILGAARQGLALGRFLPKEALVTLNDKHPAEKLTAGKIHMQVCSIRWVFGGHPLDPAGLYRSGVASLAGYL